MDQKTEFPKFPMHYRGLLLLAGMYTIAWSAFFNWFGTAVLSWLSIGGTSFESLPASSYGIVGMLIGLVIFVSAFYPVSWLYLIVAGILGKILLAIWFGLGFLPDLGWNKRTGFHLIFNEILWLIPLILIGIRAFQVKKYLEELPEEK